MNIIFSKPLEQQHISQVYKAEQTYDKNLSNYTILKPVPLKVVKLPPNTKVSVPVSNNPNNWNNSEPVVDKSTNTLNTSIASSTSSNSSNTTTSFSSAFSHLESTAESDISNYSEYIIIGGAILLVFFLFSGTGSGNTPKKFVDIEIPE